MTGAALIATRAALVEVVRERTASERVVLFEPTGPNGAFVITGAAGFRLTETASLFGSRSTTVRWLRVNREPLVLAARPEVVAYLSDEDQTGLGRLGAKACVPILTGRSLSAWLLFGAGFERVAAGEGWGPVQGLAAEALEQIRERERDSANRSRVVAAQHSHRLRLAGEVAATVAHEVKNPLAAIRSLIQFARDTDIPRTQLEAILSDVIEEVDRIDGGVRQMLELTQRAPLTHRSVDIAGILADSCRFVSAYALKKGVAVTTQSPASFPLVQGDSRELRQVFVNILLNACHACGGKGSIHVTLDIDRQKSSPLVVVSIADDGVGIAPEHLGSVLLPFFTTKADGTGLGLALSTEVIGRHGGTLELESTQGNGTLVRICLPLVRDDDGVDSDR